MLYEITDQLTEIELSCINPDKLTVGCVSSEELILCSKELGFDEYTIEASKKANPLFRTGVDVHEKYTFAELRVIDRDGQEDSVSIYIKHNLLLIVDIMDEDNSTVNSFYRALKKYPCSKINEERMLFCFIDSLLSDVNTVSETIRNELTEMEESIVQGDTGKEFNIDLLALKKRILKYDYFYGQILDITETLEENENEVLNENNLIYIANLTSKVSRLREDIHSLNNTAEHIQDAYATLLDQRMNSTMKVLTVLTTIFFPLTIIVGWYGMNFKYMPELSWRFGYLYVALFSVAIIALFIFIGKRKKWF